MNKSAELYKAILDLKPVKCNGYLQGFDDNKHGFTFAHYLLEQNLVCPWHTMATLETCHFIDGDPIKLLTVTKEGLLRPTILGPNLEKGHRLEAFIEPGTWCSFFLDGTSTWSLISHIHIPTYDESKTIYATEEDFISLFPHLKEEAALYGLKGFYNKNFSTSDA